MRDQIYGKGGVDMTDYSWLVQLAGYVISGLVALAVAGKQHSKTTALLEYRLGQLEKKMDKHNQSVERLTVLEAKFDLLEGRKNDG
jgi:hypothetical protein